MRSGGLDNLQAASWRSDDGSLRIEPLRGEDIIFMFHSIICVLDVEKVNELIRDIKNSREVD